MSNDLDKEKPEDIDYSQGYLKLPVDKGQFSNFVASLLGKPQSVSKNITGEFSFDLKTFQNINSIIEQRLIQQTEAYQIQFIGTIGFNDNSTVTIGSIEEFLTYNEFRPLISTRLTLSWIYLVKFRTKDYPEKQEIIVDVNVNEMNYKGEMFWGGSPKNSINIKINHTDRIWGTDLLSVIGSYLESILNKNENDIQRKLSNNYEAVGSVFRILSFLGFSLGGYLAIRSVLSSNVAEIQNVILNAESFRPALSRIAENIYSYQFTLLFWMNIYIILSILLSNFFGFLISGIVHLDEVSFILMTEASYKNRSNVLAKKRNRFIKFIFSILAGIALNIFSSYIFSYLSSR